MEAKIAQLIALAAYGNPFLIGGPDLQAPELLGSNSTFQYVNSLKFVQLGDSGSDSIIMTGTNQWYRHLRKSGVTKLELKISDSHFVDGIPCALKTDSVHGQDFWVPSWESIPDFEPGRPRSDNRIWNVSYKSGGELSEPVRELQLDAAMQNLISAVNEAREFASNHGLKHFVKYFDDATEAARSEEPKFRYHPDLIPLTVHTDESRRLLVLAVGSWVFGGMSSWNDQEFLDSSTERKFKQITSSLYSAVLIALVSGTNMLPTGAEE